MVGRNDCIFGFDAFVRTNINSSMKEKIKIPPHVFPNMEEWPLFKISDNRTEFVDDVTKEARDRLLKLNKNDISGVIAKAIYDERIRIKQEPWKIDPPDEKSFWNKIQKKLVKRSLDKEKAEADPVNKELLHTIVLRYAEEIVGTFKPKTLEFARKFTTVFLNRLLNTAASRNLRRIYSAKHRVYESLLVDGEVEKVRSLSKKGTVVLVPTHFSNLDSFIVGYGMDQIAGIPFPSFAAGLNLYNTGYTAYFMNRLGCYRVDRRKKNAIYLETLKTVSKLSIERGVSNLIYAGGTRSRSGELEQKVKMGLLGTAVQAQRSISEKGAAGKVFIVPVIIGYHFVLEAPYLIDEHLRRTGKEHYHKTKDGSQSLRSSLKFAWNYFSQSSEIRLSFGKPLDVLGNFVDGEGNSYDRFNKQLDIKDYFLTDGVVAKNAQREREYTKILGERIIERFHKDNVVLCSHAIAFTVFNLLKKQNADLDIYGLLRLPSEDFEYPIKMVEDAMASLVVQLKKLEAEGNIRLSDEISWETEKLVEEGIRLLGAFHAQQPLKYNKAGNVVSESFKLVYYYHNRLDHYDLEKMVDWGSFLNAHSEVLAFVDF